MKEEFVYEAPQVEIIEVAVEKGFASSGELDPVEVTNEPAVKGTNWWFE